MDRPWVVPLRTYYPSEYSDLVDRVGAASLAGEANAGNRAEESFIDDFLARKIDAIVSAPDAQLLEIVSAMAETLRTDRDCNPGVTDADTWTVQLTGRSRVVGLEIAAAHASETSGRRPRRRAGPADFEALRAWMEAMDPELARATLATPELQCRHDLLIFRAMAELPPPVGPVIVADYVRHREAPR